MSPALKRYRDVCDRRRSCSRVPFFVLKANMKSPENQSTMDRCILRVSAPVEMAAATHRARRRRRLGRLRLPGRREAGQRAPRLRQRAPSRAGALARASAGRQPPAPPPPAAQGLDRRATRSARRSSARTSPSSSASRASCSTRARATCGRTCRSSRRTASSARCSTSRATRSTCSSRSTRPSASTSRTSARARAASSAAPATRPATAARSRWSTRATRSRLATCSSRAARAAGSRAAFPVARVTKVIKRELGRDQDVDAAPTVDFSRLDAVLVLVTPPGDET